MIVRYQCKEEIFLSRLQYFIFYSIEFMCILVVTV